MKKKIFTMGKVYDLGTLGVNEVENAVQADLDKVFNAGGVRFKLREVSEKTLELTFLRKYREGEIDWIMIRSRSIILMPTLLPGIVLMALEFQIIGEEFRMVTLFSCRRENS